VLQQKWIVAIIPLPKFLYVGIWRYGIRLSKVISLDILLILRIKELFLDYVSWRTHEEGSIFIQSLITVFARTAWCHDFITMVDCVRKLIN